MGRDSEESRSVKEKIRGGVIMYQCFHCLTNGVIWDSDFDFEDFGYEGEGVVHICHYVNCGAEIEYRVPCGTEGDEDGEND